MTSSRSASAAWKSTQRLQVLAPDVAQGALRLEQREHRAAPEPVALLGQRREFRRRRDRSRVRYDSTLRPLRLDPGERRRRPRSRRSGGRRRAARGSGRSSRATAAISPWLRVKSGIARRDAARRADGELAGGVHRQAEGEGRRRDALGLRAGSARRASTATSRSAASSSAFDATASCHRAGEVGRRRRLGEVAGHRDRLARRLVQDGVEIGQRRGARRPREVEVGLRPGQAEVRRQHLEPRRGALLEARLRDLPRRARRARRPRSASRTRSSGGEQAVERLPQVAPQRPHLGAHVDVGQRQLLFAPGRSAGRARRRSRAGSRRSGSRAASPGSPRSRRRGSGTAWRRAPAPRGSRAAGAPPRGRGCATAASSKRGLEGERRGRRLRAARRGERPPRPRTTTAAMPNRCLDHLDAPRAGDERHLSDATCARRERSVSARSRDAGLRHSTSPARTPPP